MDIIIADYLAEVSLGTPVSHGSMTVVPVFAPPVLEEHEYLTLSEAMDRGALQITEVSEAGNVPQLKAVNMANKAILILDGEQLVGAKQDRVVNTTILLPPESYTVIPVSCTEHGRWRYSSRREFSSSDYVMSSESRRRKMRSVSESLKNKGSFASNQGQVWDDCASLNRKSGARSASGAMRDSFEAKRHEVENLIDPDPASNSHEIPNMPEARHYKNGTLRPPSCFHSKKPLAGTMQRFVRRRSRNIGFSASPSARALIGRCVAVMFLPVRHEPPIITASARSCATITGFVLPGAILKCDRIRSSGRSPGLSR